MLLFLQVYMFLIYMVAAASSWCLMIISGDRLISVFYPIKYKTKLTKRLAYVLMAIPWIIGLLLYGPATIVHEIFHPDDKVIPGHCSPNFINSVAFSITSSFLDLIIPYFLVAVFHVMLYVNITKRGKKIADMAANANTDHRLKHDRRIASTLTLLTGVYGVTWIPYVTAVTCATLGFRVSQFTIEFTSLLLIFNSLLNPLIYPVMQPKFRQIFRKIGDRLCRCMVNSVGQAAQP